jgi:hypothetical protein
MPLIDLHIHTTATPHHSTWEPAALATHAAAHGYAAIAATDHNSTANVAALQAAGARHGLRVISGVELDSAFNGKLWHTLLYAAPPEAAELLALCAAVFQRNAADAQALIAGLPGLGFALPDFGAWQRPPNVADVATALAQHNQLPGRVPGEHDEEVGMRFLLTQLPGAYNPVGVDEVIGVAHRLGGVAVLAHPGRSKGIYAVPATAEDIGAMVEAGLDGIEVYYPSHSPAQQAWLLEQAQRHGLLVSGGSDSHHPHQPLATWDAALVAALLEKV